MPTAKPPTWYLLANGHPVPATDPRAKSAEVIGHCVEGDRAWTFVAAPAPAAAAGRPRAGARLAGMEGRT